MRVRSGGVESAGSGVVDEVVAGVFRAPHSYTGEDVVEISCHGSPYILQRVMDLCVAAGAVPAAAGEFTQRAFLLATTNRPQAPPLTAGAS